MSKYPETEATGNLTRDPETRWTGDGKAVTAFTIACNQTRRNPQTNQFEDSEPLFLRCEAWETLAENIGNLHKGQLLHVHGRLQPNTWTDREGNQREQVRLRVANAWLPLTPPQDAPQTIASQPYQQPAYATTPNGGNPGYGAHTPPGDPWGYDLAIPAAASEPPF
ncbi:single-stranded DNA-binding protein [Mobiluncus mulieris]|uniref:Single-stranded DNA-binding protein n=1 Tax=Mobiluncus mulieris TaxID=2052 RepID=A0A7Y0Y5A9_9ACTO|nr:single-stranded DNA-binding protein [Mobiluncus mulieris]NMW66002.1 single-stranded DNA-binding protein [Mobiluncus mulieris]